MKKNSYIFILFFKLSLIKSIFFNQNQSFKNHDSLTLKLNFINLDQSSDNNFQNYKFLILINFNLLRSNFRNLSISFLIEQRIHITIFINLSFFLLMVFFITIIDK